MGDTPNKGAFEADIPADAVEEALRSVEKVEHQRRSGEGAEVPIATEGEAGGDASPGSPGEPGSGDGPEDSPQDSPRVRSLEAQLSLSQEKSRETMERLKEAHDRYVRATAD